MDTLRAVEAGRLAGFVIEMLGRARLSGALADGLAKTADNGFTMSMSDKQKLLAAMAIAAGLSLLIIGAMNDTANRQAKPRKPTPAEAQREGERIILLNLKYPLDAEFHRGYEGKDLGKGRWQAGGLVKAQNAFGARISHHWIVILTCDVTHGRIEWTCESVQLSP